MAFTCFAEENIDIAVIEAGMGGRLDSTNVITPLVSVITNIDLEHTEFLGTTLAAIAGEKAGIIKQGVPVVTGAVQPDAAAVLEAEAAGKAAPFYRLPKDFGPEQVSPGVLPSFSYRGIAVRYPDLRTGMLGRHQLTNASLALAAVECLRASGIDVPEGAVRAGLAGTAWAGRLERTGSRPDIYLDGAHNPASAAVLAEALLDLKRDYRSLILILGILRDKDHRGIIERLVPLADRVVVTRPQYARAMDIMSLADEVRPLHGNVTVTPTVGEAIASARQAAGEDDLIIVTGSLYTVGDARAILRSGPSTDLLQGLKG
jgi:dihydrofolate synthase/folylpolyglutamate synthase